MFLSIRLHPEARWYQVIDKKTGLPIPNVTWANEETGRYRQHLKGPDGKFIVDHKKGEVVSKIFKGNIELRDMR